MWNFKKQSKASSICLEFFLWASFLFLNVQCVNVKIYLRNERHNRLAVITGNPHLPSFYRNTEKLWCVHLINKFLMELLTVIQGKESSRQQLQKHVFPQLASRQLKSSTCVCISVWKHEISAFHFVIVGTNTIIHAQPLVWIHSLYLHGIAKGNNWIKFDTFLHRRNGKLYIRGEFEEHKKL